LKYVIPGLIVLGVAAAIIATVVVLNSSKDGAVPSDTDNPLNIPLGGGRPDAKRTQHDLEVEEQTKDRAYIAALNKAGDTTGANAAYLAFHTRWGFWA